LKNYNFISLAATSKEFDYKDVKTKVDDVAFADDNSVDKMDNMKAAKKQ